MLFNSLVFIFFALCFYSVWFCLQQQKHRLVLLVLASFVFYSYWDWRYLFLLVGSGLVDFFAALAMSAWPYRRRLFLLASLLVNIGFLASFKYSGFLLDNSTSLLKILGIDLDVVPLNAAYVIPIGISFYTFQSMSYTIDVYRGKLQPTSSIIHFFAYLSMFPQLVAGPIERASSLLPQLEEKRTPTSKQCWEGWCLVVQGYFKKCVIADSLAPMVNQAFAHHDAFDSGLYWWLIIAMFAFQIYGDFSGYSDIARGLGRLMGINLRLNFDHPYLSRSFTEFWQRWHISLSSWFRDYVYIPLGGNRKGNLRMYVNIWITMLLSGLWHGPAWTFLIWGAWHAALMTIEKITDWPRRLGPMGSLGSLISVLLVFALTLMSWVFFRATSFSQAWDILGHMISPEALVRSPLITGKELLLRTSLILMIAVGRTVYWAGRDRIFVRLRSPAFEPAFYGLVLIATIYLRGPGSEFIYFQF